jgi:hypothetical protein
MSIVMRVPLPGVLSTPSVPWRSITSLRTMESPRPVPPGLLVTKYGKIVPLETEVRREVLRAITDQTCIYSLGRFATWRQVLLDDVVDDVLKIEGWMTSKSSAYQRALHYS